MIIGIDFDNTIIRYDNVFSRVGLKKGIISDLRLKTKNEVKNDLISSGKENNWTELQGIVYGSHIMEAELYQNFKEACWDLIARGHKLRIISHKTQFPYIGSRINLRKAAIKWLKEKNIVGRGHNKIPLDDVFFCCTLNEKIKMVEKKKCDVFIDDLPTVLQLIDPNIKRILFNPDVFKNECFKFKEFHNWREIGSLLDEN